MFCVEVVVEFVMALILPYQVGNLVMFENQFTLIKPALAVKPTPKPTTIVGPAHSFLAANMKPVEALDRLPKFSSTSYDLCTLVESVSRCSCEQTPSRIFLLPV